MLYLETLLNVFDAFWLISSTRIWCLCPHLTSVIFQSTLKAAVLSGCSSHHQAGIPSTKRLLYKKPATAGARGDNSRVHVCSRSTFPRTAAFPQHSQHHHRQTPALNLPFTPRNSQPVPKQLHQWVRVTPRSHKNCIFLLLFSGQLTKSICDCLVYKNKTVGLGKSQR